MARNKKIISMVPAQPGWSISFNADGPDASAEDIFEHLDTFISKPVSVREEVYEYLSDAKHYIQQDAPEGAIWRLEEALKLLRRMAEKEDKQ